MDPLPLPSWTIMGQKPPIGANFIAGLKIATYMITHGNYYAAISNATGFGEF
jgi:hypothetical protein